MVLLYETCRRCLIVRFDDRFYSPSHSSFPIGCRQMWHEPKKLLIITFIDQQVKIIGDRTRLRCSSSIRFVWDLLHVLRAAIFFCFLFSLFSIVIFDAKKINCNRNDELLNSRRKKKNRGTGRQSSRVVLCLDQPSLSIKPRTAWLAVMVYGTFVPCASECLQGFIRLRSEENWKLFFFWGSRLEGKWMDLVNQFWNFERGERVNQR